MLCPRGDLAVASAPTTRRRASRLFRVAILLVVVAVLVVVVVVADALVVTVDALVVARGGLVEVLERAALLAREPIIESQFRSLTRELSTVRFHSISARSDCGEFQRTREHVSGKALQNTLDRPSPDHRLRQNPLSNDQRVTPQSIRVETPRANASALSARRQAAACLANSGSTL